MEVNVEQGTKTNSLIIFYFKIYYNNIFNISMLKKILN
jgi:hypothetical protein